MTNEFAFERLRTRIRNSFLNINFSASLGFLAAVATTALFGTPAGADGQGASSEVGGGYIVLAAGFVLLSATARFFLVRTALRRAGNAI